MITITWFYLILSLLAVGIITYLICQNFLSKRAKSSERALAELKEEHVKLQKSNKASEKLASKLQKQYSASQEKHETALSRITELEEEVSNASSNIKEKLNTLTSRNKTLEANLNVAEAQLDKSKTRYQALNDKYHVELKELKEWKSGKDAFDREMKLLKEKTEHAQQRATSYQKESVRMQDELREAKNQLSNIKLLQTKVNKLQKELKYWEQKHYDTHHELAAHKKENEETVLSNQSLKQQTENQRIEINRLKTDIQQYKDQYVKANDKYHKLASAQLS